MKIKTTKFIPFFIAGVVILFSISLHVLSRKLAVTAHRGSLPLAEQLEWLTYDARVKLAAAMLDQTTVSKGLAALFIDDVAFEKINTGELAPCLAPATDEKSWEQLKFNFPWPRFIYGQIVRELSAQGAVAIGFDVLLPNLDEPNPIEDVPLPNKGKISSDKFFAEELGKSGNVILATESNLLPAPLFLTNSSGIASISANSDYGVLRRVKAFDQVKVWHSKIVELVPAVGLDLEHPIIEQFKIIIPRKKTKDDLNPMPMEIPLNENGSMKLTADGSLDVGDDPTDEGPMTEFPFATRRVWNLGIVLAAKQLKLDLDQAQIYPEKIVLHGENGLERVIPTDSEGFLFVDWSLRFEDLKNRKTPVYWGQIPEVLINDKGRMLGEKNLANPFKNRLVVIGSIATGNNLSDFGSTPLEQHSPLVTKHLNIANSVLTGRFVHRVNISAECLIIALLGVASGLITWRTRVVIASFYIAAACVVYVLLCTWIFVDSRLWIAMAVPLGGGLVLPHFALVSYRVVFEQKEQRRVRSIFSKIVSPDVVKELLDAEEIHLGGERRKITVFFADVRGFTEFTDASQAAVEEYVRKHDLTLEKAEEYFDKQAEATLDTVNRYLATIADIVKKHHGTLDKYIGDCVMAFWGAPAPTDKQASLCVRAAIESQRAIYDLNQERFAENERRKIQNEARESTGLEPLPMLPLLTLGSGINTGFAVVGLMGSNATIFNYTVFGREVNLASRLEGVSGRGRIIISEGTYNELLREDPDLAADCQELPPTVVKGFRQAVRIFEVPWKLKEKISPQPKPIEATSPQETVTIASK